MPVKQMSIISFSISVEHSHRQHVTQIRKVLENVLIYKLQADLSLQFATAQHPVILK